MMYGDESEQDRLEGKLEEAGIYPDSMNYKVCVHVCVNGIRLKWREAKHFLEQQLGDGVRLIDKFPRSDEKRMFGKDDLHIV